MVDGRNRKFNFAQNYVKLQAFARTVERFVYVRHATTTCFKDLLVKFRYAIMAYVGTCTRVHTPFTARFIYLVDKD